MKNKAFILDFNLLEENNLSAEEFLLLIGLINNNISEICFEQFDILEEKQFIKKDNEQNYILREKGKLLLELCEIDSINIIGNKKSIKKSSRAISLELDEFIEEFRQLWKGKKLGAMGSEKACKEKMYRWMSENPKYTKDDIIKAAKLYLSTVDDITYLQKADYFIYKKDGKEESSRLSDFINEEFIEEEDWTSKLK